VSACSVQVPWRRARVLCSSAHESSQHNCCRQAPAWLERPGGVVGAAGGRCGQLRPPTPSPTAPAVFFRNSAIFTLPCRCRRASCQVTITRQPPPPPIRTPRDVR